MMRCPKDHRPCDWSFCETHGCNAIEMIGPIRCPGFGGWTIYRYLPTITSDAVKMRPTPAYQDTCDHVLDPVYHYCIKCMKSCWLEWAEGKLERLDN